MGKTLGLDLGTASIGWAIIDEQASNIIDAGVRVFPEGAEGIGTMAEQSSNAVRREHRQARRQTYRRRLRRIKLLSVLINQGMCPLTHEELRKWKNYKTGEVKVFPSNPEFTSWLQMNPYELRHRVLATDISLHELGRIFYHIIHHRGFKSGRKSKEEGALYKGKDATVGIDETKEHISDDITLGSYLYTRSIQSENRKRLRNRYTLRSWYVREFNAIWQRQATVHGLEQRRIEVTKTTKVGGAESRKTREKIAYLKKQGYSYQVDAQGSISYKRAISLKDFLGDEETGILFFQLSLRSQKHLLAPCRYEPNKTPALLSHPDYETFRALQFINTIRHGIRERLTPDQRETVLKLFNSKASAFDFLAIKKALGMEGDEFNYENGHKVPANVTWAKLKGLFPAEIWNNEQQREQIWHCFHFFDDDEKLIRKLETDFKLLANTRDSIRKIHLKEGPSNVSLKAIRNMLPFLSKGMSYSDSVLKGGVYKVMGAQLPQEVEARIDAILKEQNEEGEAIEKVKQFLRTSYKLSDEALKGLYHHSQETEKHDVKNMLPDLPNLRNPIVQTCLHELRRLVNLLSKTYLPSGEHFDKIKVEMARELKLPRKVRENMVYENRRREERNTKAKNRLDEYGLSHSRSNVQKYLLFKEIEEKNGTVICPYTGKSISISSLLGKGNQFQIEHIIPYSISLDDSFFNKTLCDAKENQQKGERTPFQFYGKDSARWEEVKQRAFQLLPYEKAKRFTSTQDFQVDNFISRQLNDTRYISKMAGNYLSYISEGVIITQGQLTADLRHKWGLNSILAPPLLVNKPNTGEGKYYGVPDKKGGIDNLVIMHNSRPSPSMSDLVLTGEIKAKVFTSPVCGENVSFPAPQMEDGRCWALCAIKSSIESLTPVFTPLGETKEGLFWLRGKITSVDEDAGTAMFECTLFGKGHKIRNDNFTKGRSYWIQARWAEEPQFCTPAKKPQKLDPKQATLYCSVNEDEATINLFRRSYRLQNVGVDNGKWIIIASFDLDYVKSVAVRNEKPQLKDRQICVDGEVANGIYTTGLNRACSFSVKADDGPSWAVFSLQDDPREFTLKQNKPPQKKDSEVLEGEVRTNEHNPPLFYPSKNRNDHRHHAVDALVVACSDTGKLQKLSRWNGQYKDRRRNQSARPPSFDPPWGSFRQDAEETVGGILISHKRRYKTLSKIIKNIQKNGEKFRSVGYAVGGQLHKETVYGKRYDMEKHEKTYRKRGSIDRITDHKLLTKVSDRRIRELIRQKLAERGIDTSSPFKIPKDFFFKDGQPQLFLPNKNGAPMPIRKVRFGEHLGNAVQLSAGTNQYVNPRNNHHVLLYRDGDGQLNEQIVTFWEVVQRRQAGQPTYQVPPGATMVCTLKINDMFILDSADSVTREKLKSKKYVAEHLYRVQKCSAHDYFFRLHTEATVARDGSPFMHRISMKAWEKLHPVKVRVSLTGELQPMEG